MIWIFCKHPHCARDVDRCIGIFGVRLKGLSLASGQPLGIYIKR